MASWKIRGRLLIIVYFFTCITLVYCKSLLPFSETEKTNYEGGDDVSAQFVSGQEGYFVPFSNTDFLSDDAAISGLQKKTFIKGQLLGSSEAAWDAMSPKLRCGDDLINLQLSGPEVENVELCRGNGVAVLLTHLPPHCGHAAPTYTGLVYATPYDGCGVTQKGGYYVMQIQWQGNSAVISCPMTSNTANETFLGPNLPEYLNILLLPSPPDTQNPETPTVTQVSDFTTLKNPPSRYPQVSLQGFWPFPNYVFPGTVYSIDEQMEKPFTTALVSQGPDGKPQQPKYPQMPWLYDFVGYPYGDLKPAPSFGSDSKSGGQALDGKPPQPKYPQMPWLYDFVGYPYGDLKPAPSSGSDSKSDGQAPYGKPQQPKYPRMPWPYGDLKPATSSGSDSESDGQAPDGKPQQPKYPQMPWLYGDLKPAPSSGSDSESDGQAPDGKPQQPKYPQMPWLYDFVGYPYSDLKPAPSSGSDSESDGQAPDGKPQQPEYPQMPWPYGELKPAPSSGSDSESDGQAPDGKPSTT
ncbi:vegetative cell wall protein gp1 [Puntigrus tetrazona]|uniref:vegetative cell wall protein gp1 n=1 Tax=Puntigrus tetrazona TaxID=1606681 RepID=UPI001C8A716B|nr:vegetative cell wall protein gp1 [Puntigrus tetrazona]